jgi:hypothetical protein
VEWLEEYGMLVDWKQLPIGLPHTKKGLKSIDGKDPLLGEGNDGGICPIPQGKYWRGVEGILAPILILWGVDWELTITLCMLIDDIQNEKELDINDDENSTLIF